MHAHEAVIADIEALTLPSGDPLRLLPWQREFLAGAIPVTRSALSVARANGKTALVAGVALSAFTGALAQQAGQVLIVASSFQQARIAFSDVLAYARPMIEAEPQRWKISDNQAAARMVDTATDSELRVIGSDPRRAHGLRPHFQLWDEVAQWGPTADRMIAALLTSTGKRAGHIMAIGTQADHDDHPWQRWIKAAEYSRVWAAPNDADPLDLRSYPAANPSWASFPLLREAVESEIAMAKRDPLLLAVLKSQRLNQVAPDTTEAHLIEAADWQACEAREAERLGQPIWGVDLGSGTAMSAIAAVWPTGRVEAIAALPEIPDLKRKGELDGVGDLYQRIAATGDLQIMGRRVVDVPQLLAEALRRWGPPSAVASDRWREHDLRQALEDSGIPLADLVTRGQGWRDGGEDVRRFRQQAIGLQLAAPQSLLIRAALREARVAIDAAGNAKLAKGSEGGRRQRARDDVAAALILAVAEADRRGAEVVEARPLAYALG